MTLLQKIEALNWFDFLGKLKSILKELLGKDRPYKVVTANLAITGTTPSLVEFENTLGTVAITRDAEGTFFITSDALFTADKTWLNISNRDYTVYSEIGRNSASELFVSVKQRDDDTDSDVIDDISIEIRVY